MNTIEKLNKIIEYIDVSREKKRKATSINFDDINLDNLDIEIVVGSKVNIQSENENYSYNSGNSLLLENYLKSISRYKKYRNKTPKYSINTLDLNLDINLEIKQKVLVEKVKRLKNTPEDIKRDINITLLENLKTSVFIYKNIHKAQKYKAKFDDLYLDIELEKTINHKRGQVVSSEKLVPSQGINTYKEEVYKNTIGEKNNKEKTNTSTLLSNRKINKDRVSILQEKLDNIRRFKEKAKLYNKPNNDLASNLSIDVTLTKKGTQLISLSKKKKIKKLEELLEAINSYREKRNEL